MIDTLSIFRSQGIDPNTICHTDVLEDGNYVVIWGQKEKITIFAKP